MVTDEAVLSLYKILGDIQRELGRNSGIAEATHENTMKTNGRVTKLEDFIVCQTEFNAQQLKFNSKIDGMYTALWNRLEEKISETKSDTKREIDEFKKLIVPSDIEIKKELVSTEGRWKVWAILATGFISLMTVGLSYYFQVKNTIQQNDNIDTDRGTIGQQTK